MSAGGLLRRSERDLRGLVDELLGRGSDLDPFAPWLVVAAHPDDETIGASWILRRSGDAHVLHVTDGAPRAAKWRSRRAASPRDAYVAQRSQEARRALAMAGVPAWRIHALPCRDQESAYALVELTRAIECWIHALRPAAVVVHAYEGGHPDHDSAAFATHAALARIQGAGWRRAPALFEMTSYHARHGVVERGLFLPSARRQVERRFDPEECDHKARMFACFATQTEVLSPFPLHGERYRVAPEYDFGRPPQPGRLQYEDMGFMRGSEWRALATRALRELVSHPQLSPRGDPC